MMTTLLNNRYQIIQLLGAGGFGETFLAEDIHMPSRRRCVIKQLKPMTNDPQMYQIIQQRFQREAATLESLGEGSDQIPNLYAYFSENGQFYLVQEWINGQTLSRKVADEGLLSETAVREILVSLLPVINYVHSKGIIYRDIKPDNIILRQPNSKPVLIDFGAVKETMATAIKPQGKANQTIVVGTPGFMSPEQAAGRPIFASDIYSLGMTAIYLLTGKIQQELEIDSQTDQIFWQQYAPHVSPQLAAVLNKAIQYHPRDRYTTAAKMLQDLQDNTSAPSRQSATRATLVMSPQKMKMRAKPTPANNYPSSQGKQRHNLVLGSLLAGGLFGSVLAIGLIRNQLPQSTPEQPVAESTPTTQFPQPALEPDRTPPAPAESPAPPIVSAPQQETTDAEPSESLPQENNTQQPEQTPVTAIPSAPRSQAEQQPTQLPSTSNSEATQQEQENQTDFDNNADSNSVPGFPIGTPESSVAAALGNPTKTSRGIWPNTRAVIYEIKPNQITLGYLFDRTSGQLRQTEVSFAQSVELETIQATLQEMLGERPSVDIEKGLQQVYQRRTNNYSFNKGRLKGVVERNNRDRIYIGVWDADLH